MNRRDVMIMGLSATVAPVLAAEAGPVAFPSGGFVFLPAAGAPFSHAGFGDTV